MGAGWERRERFRRSPEEACFTVECKASGERTVVTGGEGVKGSSLTREVTSSAGIRGAAFAPVGSACAPHTRSERSGLARLGIWLGGM